MVADRISYLVEAHQLLRKHHFCARKQRSTTHALLLLQEFISQAWRGGKTVTLASFDVKGTYNGVSKHHLLQQLRRRRLPEVLVRWIDDFSTDRKACVSVNGTTSEVHELPRAGVPQGSPLSPNYGLRRASVVPESNKASVRQPERGQWIGAQAILSSLALAVAEAEAGLLPIRERQHRHISKFWIDLHTLPIIHPRAKLRCKPTRRYKSPLIGDC